jgi:AdoMet-dependent heme synthase
MATLSQAQRHGPSAAATDTDNFFAEHGWTRVPRLVQWMATLRCPLSCEHCLAAGDDAEDMTAAEAAGLIEQVAALGVEEFLVTGGEPLVRPDLPEIIRTLRANRVRWSLNTALMPGRRTRAAIEDWPPCFVAVSVDGPEEMHDGFRGRPGTFRGAMDSIAYFAELVPGRVAAGTTVTTRNFQHLPSLFGIVIESGAARWGLHLPVAEGRAAGRKDLFLSPPQLKQLLRFAASKRNYFPVSMADEIGYCGHWEPLVRSEPFFCGAGKTHCVVLPDGAVVPCTTLDRTESAGNVLRQPLGEIWETGFAGQRSWRPEGKCRSCRYSSACEGGCWLQRRHGKQCFRGVWRMPRAVTATGMAVCIGLAAAGQAVGQAPGAEPRRATEGRGIPDRAAAAPDAEAAKMQVLQSSIVQWYASDFRDGRSPDAAKAKAELDKALPGDPGVKYFLSLAEGKLPAKIEDRASQIAEALKTREHSLCLIGLGWRAVTEWCIEATPPQQRTDAQRKAIRDATAQLGETAEAWRAEIFKDKLDPFLRRPVDYRTSFLTKGGDRVIHTIPAPGDDLHPGGGREIARQFVAAHPYAETMNLSFKVKEGAKLQCIRGGKPIAADGTLRVFDLLLVPATQAEKPVTLTFPVGTQTLDVTLPPQTELTYGDILRLVHEQNAKLFEGTALDRFLLTANTLRAAPLALPELLKRKREFEANKENAGQPMPYRFLWAMVDIYLF